jgi:hypothetical protein
LPLFLYTRVCDESYTCDKQSWTSTNKANAARNMVPKQERSIEFIRNGLRVSRIGFWSFLNISNPSGVATKVVFCKSQSHTRQAHQCCLNPTTTKKVVIPPCLPPTAFVGHMLYLISRSIRTYTAYPILRRRDVRQPPCAAVFITCNKHRD